MPHQAINGTLPYLSHRQCAPSFQRTRAREFVTLRMEVHRRTHSNFFPSDMAERGAALKTTATSLAQTSGRTQRQLAT